MCSRGETTAVVRPMPDYMDLEAWGCPDDQDDEGKPSIADLVAALVMHLDGIHEAQRLRSMLELHI